MAAADNGSRIMYTTVLGDRDGLASAKSVAMPPNSTVMTAVSISQIKKGDKQ